jgi:hypothetical protein
MLTMRCLRPARCGPRVPRKCKHRTPLQTLRRLRAGDVQRALETFPCFLHTARSRAARCLQHQLTLEPKQVLEW